VLLPLHLCLPFIHPFSILLRETTTNYSFHRLSSHFPCSCRLDRRCTFPWRPGLRRKGSNDLLTEDTWCCPNGDTGSVPPNTTCICNAFRHSGWTANNELSQPDGTQCHSGIVCVVEGGAQFRVCGVNGLQLPQELTSSRSFP